MAGCKPVRIVIRMNVLLISRKIWAMANHSADLYHTSVHLFPHPVWLEAKVPKFQYVAMSRAPAQNVIRSRGPVRD